MRVGYFSKKLKNLQYHHLTFLRNILLYKYRILAVPIVSLHFIEVTKAPQTSRVFIIS